MILTHKGQNGTIFTKKQSPSPHPARERMLNLGKMRPATNPPATARPAVHPAVKRITGLGKVSVKIDAPNAVTHPGVDRLARLNSGY